MKTKSESNGMSGNSEFYPFKCVDSAPTENMTDIGFITRYLMAHLDLSWLSIVTVHPFPDFCSTSTTDSLFLYDYCRYFLGINYSMFPEMSLELLARYKCFKMDFLNTHKHEHILYSNYSF